MGGTQGGALALGGKGDCAEGCGEAAQSQGRWMGRRMLTVMVCFMFVAFNIFLCLFFINLINMCLGMFLLVFILVWDSLYLVNLAVSCPLYA